MTDNRYISTIAEELHPNLVELLDVLNDSLSIFKDVFFAYLFGSAIRGEEFRDIDIAIYLLPCPDSSYERFKYAMRVGRELEKALSVCRREVDVRILNEAPLFFQYEVICTGQLIFQREESYRIHYERCLLSKYLDYQPIWSRLINKYLKDEPYMESQSELFQHLQEIDQSLADWERYQASVTQENIIENRDSRNMVMHAMLISIQSCIDIANYRIVQKGLRRPAVYRETFEILAEASLISRELGEELSDLAGFRNVLVHIYWRLDEQRLYEILQHGLMPLKGFRKVIVQLLKE